VHGPSVNNALVLGELVWDDGGRTKARHIVWIYVGICDEKCNAQAARREAGWRGRVYRAGSKLKVVTVCFVQATVKKVFATDAYPLKRARDASAWYETYQPLQKFSDHTSHRLDCAEQCLDDLTEYSIVQSSTTERRASPTRPCDLFSSSRKTLTGLLHRGSQKGCLQSVS
jgi:hypothetical protein